MHTSQAPEDAATRQLRAENQQLRAALDQANDKNQDLERRKREKVDECRKVMVEMQDEVGRAHSAMIETLEVIRKHLQQAKAGGPRLRGKLETVQDTNEAKLRQAAADNKTLTAMVKTAQDSNKALEAKLSQARADNEALASRLEASQRSNDALEARLRQAGADNGRLDARLGETEAELADTRERNATLTVELKDSQDDAEALEAEVNRLTVRLSDAQDELRNSRRTAITAGFQDSAADGLEAEFSRIAM
ncbi:uncharacterized protein LTHEOB_11882 [Lasiodiplodia theobromae]|uniref:uncharacterized protein n=1 Tax=Lasiodiplodia theobromae TaxID=45133 RepID=UPI0015C3FAA2|nr:uncharacterized protein LTHEOB_11882 [Lasiodiplodia theobromae]KAF4536875.1 hypothetical protein LTHEOB_11882 [Lasiodiplodia theobromae]